MRFRKIQTRQRFIFVKGYFSEVILDRVQFRFKFSEGKLTRVQLRFKFFEVKLARVQFRFKFSKVNPTRVQFRFNRKIQDKQGNVKSTLK